MLYHTLTSENDAIRCIGALYPAVFVSAGKDLPYEFDRTYTNPLTS